MIHCTKTLTGADRMDEYVSVGGGRDEVEGRVSAQMRMLGDVG